ncbi:DDE-type integrase/transposase/recombinase, partial [Saccharothrix sp. NRRL B-16348]|uniref:DDE-type integrase/transposase/recombinase n=1 Tax=Saccharothrix sp. NRRL B-16348 TaxID=1415542 RepID=UPI000AE98FF0
NSSGYFFGGATDDSLQALSDHAWKATGLPGEAHYVHTWEGWLYLATVIDIASRRVVGWATADHLRTDLVAQALDNAVRQRRPEPGVIFHADRGCPYTSHRFGTLVEDLGVRLSVGRKGQCWDCETGGCHQAA